MPSRPAPKFTWRLALLFCTASIGLSACCASVCGRCGDSGSSALDICDKVEELAKADGLPADEIQDQCLTRMFDLEFEDPEALECNEACADDKKTFVEFAQCSADCGGRTSSGNKGSNIFIKAKAKPRTAGVTLEILSLPKAKVRVVLTSSDGEQEIKKKGKTDKKGAEKIKISGLSRGSWTAEVKVEAKAGSSTREIPFQVTKGSISFEGRSKGDAVVCSLVMTSPVRETISPDKVVLASGATDKIKVRFSVIDGKSVEIDGKKIKVDKKDRAEATIRLSAHRGNIPVSRIVDAKAPAAIPVEFRLKSGKAKGVLSCNVDGFRDKIIPDFKGEPITFAGDSDERSVGKVAAVLKFNKVDRVINGTLSTPLRKVDFIVDTFYKSKGSGSCPYFNPNTGGNVRIPREIMIETVTIFDRRTGKKLKSKAFRGRRPSCPARLAPGTRTLTGYPDRAAMDKFISTTIPRL